MTAASAGPPGSRTLDILRKLLADPVRYFFIPITAIVLVVFAALYPVLQRRRRVLVRILIL